MAGNFFKLIRCEKENNADLDRSKLLGSPVTPLDLFENNGVTEDDYFVAQINCAELPDHTYAPARGWLYFFLDFNTLQPKVIYTDKEPEELREGINEAFDVESCGDPTALHLEFVEESEGFVFGENDPDLDLAAYADVSDKVTLLQIDALGIPNQSPILTFADFPVSDGYLIFLISREDLAKLDFSKVELLNYGY